MPRCPPTSLAHNRSSSAAHGVAVPGRVYVFGEMEDAPRTDSAEDRSTVCLPDLDAAFLAGVATEDVALARRVLTLPRLDAPAGRWPVPPRDTWTDPVTALVVASGALARHVDVGRRTTTHYLGPRDVVQPWTGSTGGLPGAVRWTVVEPLTLAVLDRRFALAATKWPALSLVVVDRLAEQANLAAAHTAISHLPRVEQRLLAVLWQLADRFGRPGADGTEVRLRLTHSTLGDFVGARRPTVTLALRVLVDDGLVRRERDGTWLLAAASRDALVGMLAGTPAERAAPAP